MKIDRCKGGGPVMKECVMQAWTHRRKLAREYLDKLFEHEGVRDGIVVQCYNEFS